MIINSSKPYRAKNIIINPDIKNQNKKETNNEIGYLEVCVLSSENNMPIENASVRVSIITVSGLYEEKAEGRLVAQHNTDKNGNTTPFELPALNELTPDINDYYIIGIHADGYYSAYIFNVQIYPNITTSYNINLSNISSGEEKFSFIIQPNRSKLVK